MAVRQLGRAAAAGVALLALSAVLPCQTALADDLVREDLPCNLLCRIFLGRPEPGADAAKTEAPPQSAGAAEPEPPAARRRPRPRRAAVANRSVDRALPAEPDTTTPSEVAPGPDLGSGLLDDEGRERPAPRRRAKPKRIAKRAPDSLTVGRPAAPPLAPAAATTPKAAAQPSTASLPGNAAKPAAAAPGDVTRVAPPPTSGDKASQEERRKAAIAAEEALSTRLSERARRALNSMCIGCLGRPAPSMVQGGRQVEPMTAPAPQRAP